MMPFTGGVFATANGTLVLSLAAAAFYGLAASRPPTVMRAVLKTLAVALLAVLAVMQGGPWLLVLALVLSALGDFFLAFDGEKPFLAGLGSFLAAHVAYVALFCFASGGQHELLSEPWRTVVAIVMVLAVLVMLAMLMRRIGPELRIPVTLYSAAILLMGISALTLNNFWVIAGAILFMASDTILATEKFLVSAISPHRDWMRYAVWVLYYAGQLLITLGFLIAR